ncbi:hypothetical protein H0K60_004466 [Salmonella enterica]|nr:hypothetical protein [Salmonella enterica]EFR2649710.1 hypothetical protein [Salmonella enterica]EFS1408059.1 hypothetical protein [Salmonella enterica]EHQ8162506.1 hypothetical protein [Salmonella enterica]EJZ9218159.1 hypothetical protein [Salmonella enterica]
MTRKKINPKAPLVGLYAHSFNDKDEVKYQLEVVGQLENGHYLCYLYSWIDGGDTHMKIYHLDEMCAWRFYDEEDYWRSEGSRLNQQAIANKQ